MATAIFVPQPESHPFEKRTILLKDKVKIGRVVKAANPDAKNELLFECKVLSRNHALIWYDNKKFYIQDTKSSNGTFVNSICLSRGSEKSDPVEIKSGDVIQFGVNVTDSSKSGNGEKVSHSCIIASVTLYHPDGKQADGYSEDKWSEVVNSSIKPQEVWQLSQSLQDALQREQMLENKIVTLQRLIDNSVNATDDTWQGLISEEKLLTRLNALENQLKIATDELGEDDVRLKIINLHKEKEEYEIKAKEMLEESFKEQERVKLKLADAERSLSNSEDECADARTLCDKLREEFQDLLSKYEQKVEELSILQKQAAASEKKSEDALIEVKQDNEVLKTELNMAEKRGSSLAVEVESLQAECDFMQNQIAAMKERLEQQTESQNDSAEPDSLETEDEISILRQENADLLLKLSYLDDNKNIKTETVEESIQLQRPSPTSDNDTNVKMLTERIDKLHKLQDLLFNIQSSVLQPDSHCNESEPATEKEDKINVNGIEKDEDQTVLLDNLLESCYDRVEALKDQISTVGDKVHDHPADAARLQYELESAQETNQQLETKANALQELLGGEEMKIESLQSEVESLKDELNKSKQEKKIEEDYSARNSELEELKQRYENDIKERLQKEAEMEAELSKVRNESNHIAEKSKDFELEISRLESEKKDSDKEKEKMENRCQDLEQEVNKKNEIIQSIETDNLRHRKQKSAESLDESSNSKLEKFPSLATTEVQTAEVQTTESDSTETKNKLNHIVTNVFVFVFLMAILFMTLIVMDMIRIVPGNSPLFSANAWTRVWHTIF